MLELTMKELREILGCDVKIIDESEKRRNIHSGDSVNVAGIEWVVLDKIGDMVMCMTKDVFYENVVFNGDEEEYINSDIRKILNNDFLMRIRKEVNENDIFNIDAGLLSLYGIGYCGKITDKIGILNFGMYLKYNYIFRTYPTNTPYWLITPWVNKQKGSMKVTNIYACNAVSGAYSKGDAGMRPFCVFSSSIF